MAEQMKATVNMAQFLNQTEYHRNTLSRKTAKDYAEVLTWDLPKTGLLSNVWLKSDITLKITNNTSATVDLTPLKKMSIYKIGDLLRYITLDLNTSTTPMKLSGGELAFLNALQLNNDHVSPNKASCFFNIITSTDNLTAGSSATITIRMNHDIEVAFNQRDLYGLLPLQGNTLVCTLTVDFSEPTSVIGSKFGKIEFVSATVMPTMKTWTIPKYQDTSILPDTSNIKKVSCQSWHINESHNSHHFKCGTDIYRKIYVMLDSLSVTDITSNLDMILEQNKHKEQIDAETLIAQTQRSYGFTENPNVLVFDFSDNGIPNYGSARDYINSKSLTEFWLEFNSSKEADIRIVTECIQLL